MSFREYLTHGWKLCNIPRGFKGPVSTKGWSLRENAITDPALGPQLAGAGLLHAWSGTCALDVDDYGRTREWLKERSIDLDALCTSADAVRIASGRAGRAKLLYSLPAPLASKKFAAYQAPSPKTGKPETYHAFELRCANAEGLSVQDVLPPSIHPGTGRPYEWQYGDDLIGHWSNPPPLPETLRQLWLAELQPQTSIGITAPRGADPIKLRELLDQQDPDTDYDSWLRIGMALHYETAGMGFALWDEWSARGSKYKGRQDLETHWRSFKPDAANPVTLGTLLSAEIAKIEAFPLVEPDAAPRGRFKPIPPDEFMTRPPISFIVDDVLPRAEIGVIFGGPGSGKTFLALDIGAAIARGTPWRDRKVKQGRVVYIAGEDANGVALRMRAYRQQFGECPVEVIPCSPNFVERNDIAELIRELQAGGPISVLFVDTLTTATPTADEQSKDMAPAFEHAKTISKVTGALVMFVHHSGKDQTKGMRGWSGMLGYLDVEIEVVRYGVTRTATITKGKNFPDGAAFNFRLLPVELGIFDEKPVTSCIVDAIATTATRSQESQETDKERFILNAIADALQEASDVRIDDVWVRVHGLITRRSMFEKTLLGLSNRKRIVMTAGLISFPEVVA